MNSTKLISGMVQRTFADNMETFQCKSELKGVFGYFSILPFLQIIFNLVPFLAITCNKRKLSRLNTVYIYVKSTLLSNTFHSVFMVYLFLQWEFSIERPFNEQKKNYSFDPENHTHVIIMRWFTFRKAVISSSSMLMLNNVMGLIYGLKQRTFMAALPYYNQSVRSNIGGNRMTNIFSSMSSLAASHSGSKKLRFRKLQAYISVCFCWALPAGCCLLATFYWNCVEECVCLPGFYYSFQNCYSDKAWCSKEWTPMSGEFSVLLVATWVVQVTVVVTMLCKSVKSYRRHMNFKLSTSWTLSQSIATLPIRAIIPRDMTIKPSLERPVFLQSFKPTTKGKKNENETSRKSTALPTTVKEPSTVESSVDAEIPNFSTGLQYNTASSQNSLPEERPSKLSPSLKLVIVLSLLVISSTFPMALIFSFDIVPSARSAFHHSIGFLAYTCLSLYVITCPIFMVKYLADLKTSTNQLLLRCISRQTKAARSHGNADSRRGDDITN